MGLFVLDLEKPQTRKSRVKAAIGNLEIWLEEFDGGNNNDYDHLIQFAHGYITEALNGDKEDGHRQ